MKDHETLILSKSDIASCLSIMDIVEAVEEALRAHGEKKVIMPPKLRLPLGDQQNWPACNSVVLAMPAYIDPINMVGIKWAGGFWDNLERGLPSITAVIILTDPRTGFPLAIMDGSWITDFRTAAVSGVGAKYLAKKDSQSMGIFGAGTQGRTHLMVFNKLFELEQVKVFDIREEVAEKMAEEMSDKVDIPIAAMRNMRDVAEESDIIITATTAKESFLKGEYLSEGVYIAAIGSYNEISKGVIDRCNKIIVDDLEQTKHGGNLASFFENKEITDERIYAEIGEIVAGRKPGREREDENILFVSIGMSSEDVMVAYKAYKTALDKKIGKFISLGTEVDSFDVM